MFCGVQPIELNATTRLFASQASMRLVAEASICATCSASTTRLPPAVMRALFSQASALLSTVFTAMIAADAVPRHDVAVLDRGDDRRVGRRDRDAAAGR